MTNSYVEQVASASYDRSIFPWSLLDIQAIESLLPLMMLIMYMKSEIGNHILLTDNSQCVDIKLLV